jgi:hypothetical protein
MSNYTTTLKQIVEANAEISRLRGSARFEPNLQLEFEPCTAEELAAAEARLGIKLPKSYREFLVTTNGFGQINTLFGRLYGAKDIQWFRDSNPDWIESFVEPREGDVSEQEHLIYGNEQDPVIFRTAYLKCLLKISEPFEGAVYLLNPEVKDIDGEWEAWAFANWYAGAYRCQSFAGLLKSEWQKALREAKLLKIPVDEKLLIRQALPTLQRLVRDEGLDPAEAAIEYLKRKMGDDTFEAWLLRRPVLQALVQAVNEVE